MFLYFYYKKNKKAEEVGASAERVARPEGPLRATPRGQRARSGGRRPTRACDAGGEL